MKSMVIVFLVLLGVAMISANDEELLEILREERNDPAARQRCGNDYKVNICGRLVTPMHCMSKKRMGRFARSKCKFMCGFC